MQPQNDMQCVSCQHIFIGVCTSTTQTAGNSLVNLSRSLDQPFDDGSIALMGSLCFPAAELGVALYFSQQGPIFNSISAHYDRR